MDNVSRGMEILEKKQKQKQKQKQTKKEMCKLKDKFLSSIGSSIRQGTCFLKDL